MPTRIVLAYSVVIALIVMTVITAVAAPSPLMAILPLSSALMIFSLARDEHLKSQGIVRVYRDRDWEDLFGSVRPQ